jgi:ribosomal protein S18 acetylase RimI-like enzyme
MTVQIRRMEDMDYPVVSRLIQEEIYGENLSPERMEKWIRSHLPPVLQGFVAEDQGKIVGVVLWILYDLWGKEFSFELSWIAVEEDQQGKGIGKQLLEKSFGMLLEDEEYMGNTPACIILDVDADNESALAFYRGWLRPFREILIQNYWKKGGVDTYFLYVRPENILAGECKGNQ